MFLNDEGPIAGGRELWGFPKKLAQPTLRTEIDTLVGTLDYGPLRVATGTMGYKHREADLAQVKASLAAPNFLLKIIPHVDGTPRICELVEYHLEHVTIKGAWTGPAALHLSPHALAPVAELPVLEVVSAIHILARPYARTWQSGARLFAGAKPGDVRQQRNGFGDLMPSSAQGGCVMQRAFSRRRAQPCLEREMGGGVWRQRT